MAVSAMLTGRKKGTLFKDEGSELTVEYAGQTYPLHIQGVRTLVLGTVLVDLLQDPIDSEFDQYRCAEDSDEYTKPYPWDEPGTLPLRTVSGVEFTLRWTKQPTSRRGGFLCNPPINVEEFLNVAFRSLSGEMITPAARQGIRFRVKREGLFCSEPSLSGYLLALLKAFGFKFLAHVRPVLQHYSHKFRSQECGAHWTQLVKLAAQAEALDKQYSIMVPAHSEEKLGVLFKECLCLLGSAPTKHGFEALDFAKEQGNAGWIRSILGFERAQRSSSSLEEGMAEGFVNWRAQSQSFVSGYVLSQGDRGVRCLETLQDAITAFIRDGGDIAGVDVTGLVWHWNTESRNSVYKELTKSMQQVLQYETVHKDRIGWQWVKHTLRHPLWISPKLGCEEDRILFDDLCDYVEDQVKSKSATDLRSEMKKLVDDSPESWKELCEFKLSHPKKAVLRQDQVEDGPKVRFKEDRLREITLTQTAETIAFDALRQYDTSVFLFDTLTHAHLLNGPFEAAMRGALEKFGEVKIGPVKNASRIVPKSEEYAMDSGDHCRWPYTACVIDVIRGSVTVQSLPQLIEALKSFDQFCEMQPDVPSARVGVSVKIARLKNGFSKYGIRKRKSKESESKEDSKEDPSVLIPDRYTDVKMNVIVRGKNPHSGELMAVVGEVQFLLECVLKTKQKAHELYEVTRSERTMRGASMKIGKEKSISARLTIAGWQPRHLAPIIAVHPLQLRNENLDFRLILRNTRLFKPLFTAKFVDSLVRSNRENHCLPELFDRFEKAIIESLNEPLYGVFSFMRSLVDRLGSEPYRAIVTPSVKSEGSGESKEDSPKYPPNQLDLGCFITRLLDVCQKRDEWIGDHCGLLILLSEMDYDTKMKLEYHPSLDSQYFKEINTEHNWPSLSFFVRVFTGFSDTLLEEIESTRQIALQYLCSKSAQKWSENDEEMTRELRKLIGEKGTITWDLLIGRMKSAQFQNHMLTVLRNLVSPKEFETQCMKHEIIMSTLLIWAVRKPWKLDDFMDYFSGFTDESKSKWLKWRANPLGHVLSTVSSADVCVASHKAGTLVDLSKGCDRLYQIIVEHFIPSSMVINADTGEIDPLLWKMIEDEKLHSFIQYTRGENFPVLKRLWPEELVRRAVNAYYDYFAGKQPTEIEKRIERLRGRHHRKMVGRILYICIYFEMDDSKIRSLVELVLPVSGRSKFDSWRLILESLRSEVYFDLDLRSKLQTFMK